MSATPNETAHRRLTLDAARAMLAAEKARRAQSGRPTPPADPQARWITLPPGTHLIDEAKQDRKRRHERDRLARQGSVTPPRLPVGPDRTCGNCGAPERHFTRGRCDGCDTYYRRHGVERSVTPRYGASKL